ncbi:MAG: hypothetical protein OHK0017_03320 [Patescibacteria group bacterium]
MTFFPEKIDWAKLSKPDFWLEGIAGQNMVSQLPISADGFRNLFLLIFAILIVSGIFIKLYKIFLPIQHPLQPRISVWTNNLIWMGTLGVFWWLFNQWGPLLFIGSKLWIIVGLIWFLVLLYFIVKYFITEYKLEISYYKKKYLSESNTK